LGDGLGPVIEPQVDRVRRRVAAVRDPDAEGVGGSGWALPSLPKRGGLVLPAGPRRSDGLVL